MTDVTDTTDVGEIVAADVRASGIFERFGIDFCCHGRRSLVDACREASVDPAAVRRALAALPPAAGDEVDVTTWPVDLLIEHIVSTHHAYTREALVAISGYLAKLVNTHGVSHPELAQVVEVFSGMDRGILPHLMKEELVLFPYIRELAAARNGRRIICPFGTVENPICMMQRDHLELGDELRRLRRLTNGYTAPADGCTTYQVCLAEMERFEIDLHRHIHLEDNVLFPRAVEYEQASRPG